MHLIYIYFIYYYNKKNFYYYFFFSALSDFQIKYTKKKINIYYRNNYF